MRTEPLLVLGALLLAAVAARASDATTPDCTRWTLAGYQLGMTKSEALAVHGGKLKKEGRELRPTVVGFDHVRVVFDAADRVQSVSMQNGVEQPGMIKRNLLERYGPPTFDGLQMQPWPVWGGTGQGTETRWESVECDSDLLLGILVTGPGLSTGAVSQVLLVRHGVAFPDPRIVPKPFTGS